MEIRGYLKTSVIEWPGKISSVIFVPGCNFRCPFCYNRDLVLNPKKLAKFSEGEIIADLKKRKKWVEGVVVTGGEPTLQTDLSRFLSRCKQMGFLTMIETNGSNPSVISKLVISNLLDFIAMDIKGPLDERYIQIANYQLQITNIKKSIRLILDSGLDFEFRTTVTPGIHNKKVLLEIAKQLRQITNHRSQITKLHWYLQDFQPKNCLDPKFTKIKPYSEPEMKEFLVVVKKTIPQTYLR